MKAPNVVSLLAMLLVVLPAVATAVLQQFPPEEFWWASLITIAIGALVKGIEVWIARARNQPGSPASFEAAPRHAPESAVRQWLVD